MIGRATIGLASTGATPRKRAPFCHRASPHVASPAPASSNNSPISSRLIHDGRRAGILIGHYGYGFSHSRAASSSNAASLGAAALSTSSQPSPAATAAASLIAAIRMLDRSIPAAYRPVPRAVRRARGECTATTAPTIAGEPFGHRQGLGGIDRHRQDRLARRAQIAPVPPARVKQAKPRRKRSQQRVDIAACPQTLSRTPPRALLRRSPRRPHAAANGETAPTRLRRGASHWRWSPGPRQNQSGSGGVQASG